MKKLSLAFAILLAVTFMFQVSTPTTVKAADAGAAAAISIIAPGGGEWYNDGFQRSFPWVECIAGVICPCFRISSVVDAANGDVTERIRLDFWSTPTK